MAEFAIIKKSTLVNIANAIREMQGLPTDESEDGYVLIPTANMADEIRAIETGTDLSATTLTSGAQLLSPLAAYDAEGNLITGTIPTKTQNDLTVSGAQVKVPAGYYENLVTKSVATTGLGTPTIAVDANGKITATVTHTASGYVEADAKSATKQLTTQAATTITPSTSTQTAVASGVYTIGEVKVAALTNHGTITPGTSAKTYTGRVTIAGDSDLVASNIRSGINIFGVSGTMTSQKSAIITNNMISRIGNGVYEIKLGFTITRISGLALLADLAWSDEIVRGGVSVIYNGSESYYYAIGMDTINEAPELLERGAVISGPTLQSDGQSIRFTLSSEIASYWNNPFSDLKVGLLVYS